MHSKKLAGHRRQLRPKHEMLDPAHLQICMRHKHGLQVSALSMSALSPIPIPAPPHPTVT